MPAYSKGCGGKHTDHTPLAKSRALENSLCREIALPPRRSLQGQKDQAAAGQSPQKVDPSEGHWRNTLLLVLPCQQPAGDGPRPPTSALALPWFAASVPGQPVSSQLSTPPLLAGPLPGHWAFRNASAHGPQRRAPQGYTPTPPPCFHCHPDLSSAAPAHRPLLPDAQVCTPPSHLLPPGAPLRGSHAADTAPRSGHLLPSLQPLSSCSLETQK